jgi:hypothetical protein
LSSLDVFENLGIQSIDCSSAIWTAQAGGSLTRPVSTSARPAICA